MSQEEGSPSPPSKLPRTLSEAFALAIAFMLVALVVQLIGSLLDRASFIHPEIRKYVVTSCFAMVAPAFIWVKGAVGRFADRQNVPAPDRRTWLVSAGTLAALLFGWSEIVSLASASALISTVARLTQEADVDAALQSDVITDGVMMIRTPLTVLAAIIAGALVARRNPRFTLILATAAGLYGVLSIFCTWLVDRENLTARFHDAAAGGTLPAIGFGIGLAITPALVFIASMLGAWSYRLRRKQKQ